MEKEEMLRLLQEKYPEIIDISGRDRFDFKRIDEQRYYLSYVEIKIKSEILKFNKILFHFSIDEEAFTQKHLEQIIKEFPDKFKELEKEYAKWAETPEGYSKIYYNNVKKMSRDIIPYEDPVTITVLDVRVEGKNYFKHYLNVESSIALIRVIKDNLKETYLIEYDEKGVKKAYPVPNNCRWLGNVYYHFYNVMNK